MCLLYAVVFSSDWIELHSCDWCSFQISFPLRSSVAWLYTAVVFLDSELPGLWDFNSIILFDVVRVRCYVNCLFYPACVEMGITINKLYFHSRAGSFWCCRHAPGWQWSMPLQVGYACQVP